MNSAMVLAGVSEGIVGRTLKIRQLPDTNGQHRYDIVVSHRSENIDLVGGPMTEEVMHAWLIGYLSCLDGKFYSPNL